MGRDAKGYFIDLRKGLRGLPKLLSDYDQQSLEELKKDPSMMPRDLKMLEVARSMRAQFSAAIENPKDFAATRKRIMQELQRSPEEGGLGIGRIQAWRYVSAILDQIAEGDKASKQVHRMILDRRNQMAWELAHQKEDLKGMNDADANYIKVHQLDEPDEEKLDAESIQIPDIIGTTRYSDVLPTASDEDVWVQIKKAERVAKAGIIDLKEGRDYVIGDIEEFDEIEKAAEQVQSKPK